MIRFIKRHFFSIVIISLILIIILMPFIINSLFKNEINIPFFKAEFTVSDALGYAASCMAMLGTLMMAYASLRSSKKSQDIANQLSEENNKLQKILIQNSYPAINIRDVDVGEKDEAHSLENEYQHVKGNQKKFCSAFMNYEPGGTIKICVNIDGDEMSKDLFVKTMEFSIENASQVLIRHIAFNELVMIGYKELFEPVRCRNLKHPESGESILLSPQQKTDVILYIFYKDTKYEKAWENPAGGLCVNFYITNTSITGIKFKQYIIVSGTNEGLSRVFIGDWEQETW